MTLARTTPLCKMKAVKIGNMVQLLGESFQVPLFGKTLGFYILHLIIMMFSLIPNWSVFHHEMILKFIKCFSVAAEMIM